jgi:hypothetical protein
MPRKEYNIGRSRAKDYSITINGLLTKRANLLEEQIKLDARARQVRQDLEALDHVLTSVMQYEGDLTAIKPTGQKVFRYKPGHLTRAVFTVLRQSDKPLTSREIAVLVNERDGRYDNTQEGINKLIAQVSKVCGKFNGSELKREKNMNGACAWVLPEMRG